MTRHWVFANTDDIPEHSANAADIFSKQTMLSSHTANRTNSLLYNAEIFVIMKVHIQDLF